MKRLFKLYLLESDNLRSGYIDSLEKPSTILPDILKHNLKYPKLLQDIYQTVAGTKADIENQVFFDFIPGYRLIHEKDSEKALKIQNKILKEFSNKNLLPFLMNYSSDFVSVEVETGAIYHVYHDDLEIYLAHKNSTIFLETLISFYREKVYFLDEDGYLDYDEDKEYEVASSLNPGIEFWIE